jgi:hypothetical protein
VTSPSVPKREVKIRPALLRPLETLTISGGACAVLRVTSHPPLPLSLLLFVFTSAMFVL